MAYIGHVDRAWAYSFLWKSVHSQILPFVRLAASLLDGRTVGFALDDIAQRRAGVNYELLQLLDDIKRAGRIVGDKELADLWLTYHDTQSFVIIGDPAVRARQPATE
ncbi:hypothetical protein [Mycolicibacterium peregrinum]|uniref:hypothetical protein n=1 Tax=Mycolicibacterium peregrinum TaxID=43304 RepID=UPI003AABA5FC